MTHVVHLTSVHYPFDPRIFHKQLRTLSEAGYQTTLVAHHEESITRDGIRILSMGEVTSRTERWSNLHQFYTTAVDLDAAVYHFHDPELLPVGAALSARTDAAIVYDIHEDYADAIRVREWIPEKLKPVLASGFPALQSTFATQFDAIVTADDSTQAKMRARGHDPVIALRNFPRVEEIEIGDNEIDRDQEFILVYVGGLDQERGLMRMLRLTVQLRKQGLDVGLWLLGPFQNDEIEEEAQSFIQSSNITKHIKFFGYIDYDNIFSYISEADIGLLLVDQKRFKRNVPTKLFEYLYSGLPVIATQTDSIQRYIDQSYACLVPETDVSAQATTVAEILRNESLRKEMGTNGRNQVISEYCWEKEEPKLINLYKSLI